MQYSTFSPAIGKYSLDSMMCDTHYCMQHYCMQLITNSSCVVTLSLQQVAALSMCVVICTSALAQPATWSNSPQNDAVPP